MTVLPFPAAAPSFVERFRQTWQAGDYIGCMTGASFELREVQQECIEAAEALTREAQQDGASIAELTQMDVALRAMERIAAVAPTKTQIAMFQAN